MSQIFISHVEEDAQIALDIAQALEAAGYRTWYYERDSCPGPSYLLQIDRAIVESQAIVLIISPQSVRSHQVTKEVVRAHESGKAFLPVLSGMSHAEFQEQQPEWRVALGAAASIPVPPQGVSAVLPRILRGLEKLKPLKEPQPLSPDAGTAFGAPAIERSPESRPPWLSKSRTALGLGLTSILFVGALAYLIKPWIDQQRLERRLAQATEFSDAFIDGTAYWSAPQTWVASKGNLQVKGPGIGFIKDRMFRDFTVSFDLQLLNRKGAIWVVRAKDERNYYHFQLLGPEASPPNAIVTSLCKDGKLTPLMTLPVNQDLSQADDSYHIIIEARGSTISHQIQVTSKPDTVHQKLAYLQDQTFSHGGIGFGTKDGEEFRVRTVTVVPLPQSLQTSQPTQNVAGE
jgi:hypothetical protein